MTEMSSDFLKFLEESDDELSLSAINSSTPSDGDMNDPGSTEVRASTSTGHSSPSGPTKVAAYLYTSIFIGADPLEVGKSSGPS